MESENKVILTKQEWEVVLALINNANWKGDSIEVGMALKQKIKQILEE